MQHRSSPAEDEREEQLHALSRDYQEYRVWWAGDIWYSSGPCADASCPCMRTLHAPTPDQLRDQLDQAVKARADQSTTPDTTQPGLRLVSPVLDVEAAIDRVVETVRRIQQRGRE